MRITWTTEPIQLAQSEYYLGYLGRLEVARLDSNLSRDTWKLKLRVPGYATDAPGGVRYGSPEEGYQAAEEILGRWMADVGMQWDPGRERTRTWTRWGIQYDGITPGEITIRKSRSEAEADVAREGGLFADGVVVTQRIDEVYNDWEPVA